MDTTAHHRRHRAAAHVLLLGLLLALLSGCGTEQTSDEPDQAGAEDGVIVIVDFEYQVPSSVPAGSQVTIRNDDDVGHTVTSDEPAVFDVSVAPGEEATLTVPDEPGEYPFHCTPHPTMTATLIVE